VARRFQRVKGVCLTRSRPYHKNDNRFVEQKSAILIRAYLGDERLETDIPITLSLDLINPLR
jgi:hypothetical protein